MYSTQSGTLRPLIDKCSQVYPHNLYQIRPTQKYICHSSSSRLNTYVNSTAIFGESYAQKIGSLTRQRWQLQEFYMTGCLPWRLSLDSHSLVHSSSTKLNVTSQAIFVTNCLCILFRLFLSCWICRLVISIFLVCLLQSCTSVLHQPLIIGPHCTSIQPYYCRLGDLLCLFCVYRFVCHYCLCICVFSCFRCFLSLL